jgi:ankyrin repeat protein
MAACYGGHLEIARRLLARGARTDVQDRMHKPAMVYAAGQGRTALIVALIEAGVSPNAAYEHQLTALMWAAGQGHVDSVTTLLAKGADPALRDDRGLTAAEIARQAGHTQVAELLASR